MTPLWLSDSVTLPGSSQNSTSIPVWPSDMSSSPTSASLPLPSSSVPPNRTKCSFNDPPLQIPLAVIYSLFFVFGLVGNLLALWVFLFLHTRRNSVRVLLINCAVADLILLACLPFRIHYHTNGNIWPLGPLACKVVGNLFYMNMYISIALLGLIGMERYVRLKGRSRGRARRLWGQSGGWSWVACAVLWVFSLAALMPMIMTGEGDEEKDRCFQYKKKLGTRGKAYFNMTLVLFFWAVFTVLVVSYGKIAALLTRVSRDKPDLPNAQRYGRTAKKSFFVLFLFTVCFAPYHAFRPVYILSQLSQSLSCDYLQLVDRTNELMLLLSAFNSCLDPVMYFLLSGSARKTALRVLSDRLGKRLDLFNEGTSNSSTTEYRRPSLFVTRPHCVQNPSSSSTPRTSMSLVHSTLQHTGLSGNLTTSQQIELKAK